MTVLDPELLLAAPEQLDDFQRLALTLLLDIGTQLLVLTDRIGALESADAVLADKVTQAADSVMQLGPMVSGLSGGLLGKLMGGQRPKTAEDGL